MKQSWIVAFAFIGVFLCGGIVGGLISFRYGPAVVAPKATEQFGQQNLKKMGELLELTPDQKQKIRPILVKTAKEVQVHRKEIAAIGERTEAEIRPLLTEAQRVKYDEFRKHQREREQKWQNFLREQRAKRAGEPPPTSENMPTPPGGD